MHLDYFWLSKKEEKLLNQHFGSIVPDNILDVGGNSDTTKYLKARFPDSIIHCINIDEETLNKIDSDVISKLGSAEEMPFESNSFDLIFCRDAYGQPRTTSNILGASNFKID